MDECTGSARDFWKTLIIKATAAQFGAVLLAAIGCAGVLWSVNKGSVRWSGILFPFLLAFVIGGFGLSVYLWSLRKEKKDDVRKIWYVSIVLLCLYADGVLLSIMVGFSGGVKQSLFCPLFFAIPAMGMVFLPQSAGLHIYSVAGVTLVGYLVVYWLPDWVPHLFMTGGVTPNLFYSICECIVLGGSVALTVLMSRMVPRVV